MICEQGFASVFSGSLFSLIGTVSLIGAIVIALMYMLGNAISNPKVTLWAKTEIFQLFLSAVFVILFMQLIVPFGCGISAGSLADLFNIPTVLSAEERALPLYSFSQNYFIDSAQYSHDVLSVTRYHLGGFNILEGYSVSRCTSEGSSGDLGDQGKNLIFCLFGSFLGNGAGAGYSVAPDSGYALSSAALSVAFQAQLMALFSLFNFSYILEFVTSGFLFVFLPLGLLLRSFPFMRGLGSILICITVSFALMYPLILSLVYLDFKTAHPILVPPLTDDMEAYVPDSSINARANSISVLNIFENSIKDNIFPNGILVGDILAYTASVFLIGVFIPTLALLAAVASVGYMNRFLGEEVDLSRIVQMM